MIKTLRLDEKVAEALKRREGKRVCLCCRNAVVQGTVQGHPLVTCTASKWQDGPHLLAVVCTGMKQDFRHQGQCDAWTE